MFTLDATDPSTLILRFPGLGVVKLTPSSAGLYYHISNEAAVPVAEDFISREDINSPQYVTD